MAELLEFTRALTDADWSAQVEIFGKDATQGIDWTASGFEVTYVPLRALSPAAGDIHTFASPSPQISAALVTVDAVEVTVLTLALTGGPTGDFAGWRPDRFKVEVVKIDGAARRPLLTGVLPVLRGGSDAALGSSVADPATGTGSVRLYADQETIQVVVGEGAAALEATLQAAAGAEADAGAAHADRLVADNDVILAGTEAAAAHTDRLISDNDLIVVSTDTGLTHNDRLAADADATATAADRVDVDRRTTWITVAADHNVVAGERIKTNSTAAGFNLFAPPNPADGDQFETADFVKMWGTHPVTLKPNGHKVRGSAADYPLNVAGGDVVWVFEAAIDSWELSAR